LYALAASLGRNRSFFPLRRDRQYLRQGEIAQINVVIVRAEAPLAVI